MRRYFNSFHRQFRLADQILRSGTSIAANIAEAQYAFSRREFAYKMNIALSEAAETQEWLTQLVEGNYLTRLQFESMNRDCSELIAMLTCVARTAKRRAR